MNDSVQSMEAGYREALELCAMTAAEEYPHAHGSLARTQAALRGCRQNIQKEVDAIAESPEAHAYLSELAKRLDNTQREVLDTALDALERKKAQLSRFTVTLFGRTMAGKSTIREAITRGDGGTIGKGAQRTTRDVRRYVWNHLRIVDTPGIGAYEGQDSELALSMTDESDVLLFLLSSDSIQESTFQGMRKLRDQNKPVIFVLNVMCDLTRPVFMRRFLRSPESFLGKSAIKGHEARIRKLAEDKLGMRQVKIVPIHAQAAFLATRPEHSARADALRRVSRIDQFLQALTFEVKQRGPVRRVQTILDGTVVKLMDVEEFMRENAKLLDRSAKYRKEKFAELDTRLDVYIGGMGKRIETQAANLLRPLRYSVASFVEENIERQDVNVLWKRRVEDEGIDRQIGRFQERILDEVREILQGFNQEMAFEMELGHYFTIRGPDTVDPWDVKRTLRWISTAGSATAGVAAVMPLIIGAAAANFWNPVGWISLAVALGTWALSWLFEDREKELQRERASAAKYLRKQIDEMQRDIESRVKKWFYDNFTRKLVHDFRRETRQGYTAMFSFARTLRMVADSCSGELELLNRRLLLRCGAFVGKPLADDKIIAAVARDPGLCTKVTIQPLRQVVPRAGHGWGGGLRSGTKLMWKLFHGILRNDRKAEGTFCQEVGRALGERIHGVALASRREMIASALTPARVSPAMVRLNDKRATVGLPKSEVGRAIGKNGNNVRLASQLVGVRIEIEEGTS